MEARTYDERVRALEEELGVPTSDAQAMVDAEDYLAARRCPHQPSSQSS